MEAHYKKLYQLQDAVLKNIFSHRFSLYLGGGTALSRFYLQHRYSDDLDLFTHDVAFFSDIFRIIQTSLTEEWPSVEIKTNSRDFKRLLLEDGGIQVKIDLVADRLPRIGLPVDIDSNIVDTVRNIASNKIGALISRDEGRDLIDLWSIAKAYPFVWPQLIGEAEIKGTCSTGDILFRLQTFPIELVKDIPFIQPFSEKTFRKDLKTIIADIENASPNSLALSTMPPL